MRAPTVIGCLSAVVAAVLAALAPDAIAAKSFTLDASGRDPHIAVDNAGNGHIVWNERVIGGDDLTHYCKLPRGSKKCATERLFPIAATDFDGPHVVLGGGEVVIVTSRCCTNPSPLHKTYALRSADGGQTFSAPRLIASNETSFGGGAYFGPGGFSISTIGSVTSGTHFQAAPLNAASPVTARANLSAPTGEIGFEGSVGFLDPLTPIAAFTDLENLYTRRYAGFGDYNSVANWEPVVPLGPGDEPRLASGKKGTYLLYRQGNPGKRRLKVKLYNEVTRTFISPTNVSKVGEPIFRDFLEDAGGNLHATWVDNGDPDRIRYRRSADGQSWGDTKLLERSRDAAYRLDAGAGSDGGGWTLWTTEAGGGAVRAAPFSPLGPGEGGGGGACVPQVTYGKTVAIAKQGCLKRDGKTYTTSGGVRLNGLDLEQSGGAAANRAPGAQAAASKIEIDTGNGRLKSTGDVLVKAGNIELQDGKLAMKLPSNGGPIKDLAGNPVSFDTEKLKSEFLDLPVSGQTTPVVTGGQGIRVPVNLKLPDPFSLLLGGTVTGRSELLLDNGSGLILEKGAVEVRANDLSLGLIAVRDLHVVYQDDPSVLQGGGSLHLASSGAGIATNFGLRDGEFEYGNAQVDFPDPGIPIATLVFLKQINFAITTDPLKLAGGGKVNAGPAVGPAPALAQLDGQISYTFPDAPNPGIFRINGDGSIVSIPVASAFAQYKTSGRLDVGANVEVGFGPIDLADGSLSGAVDLNSGAFTLTGSAEVDGIPLFSDLTSVTVKALLSNKALAGCASVSPFGSAGAALFWNGGYDIFGGCNLGKFKTVKAAQAAAALTMFELGKGLPHAGVVVDGIGPGAPRVRLVGPGGVTLEAPAAVNAVTRSAVGSIQRYGPDGNTYAMLDHPAAGAWRVEAVSGANEIGAVQTAAGLPTPKVEARVRRGKGRERTLRYAIRKAPGQKVTFMEQGNGVASRIGSASGGRGKIDFKAADGPRGERQIVATVLSGDFPRAQLNVASYEAPKPIKPAKPRDLRAKRRGSKLLVSWRRVRAAERYAAAITLRDGRRLSLLTKKPKLTVKKVPGIVGARIEVAGLKADNMPGRSAKAKLKPKPKKRGKRR